MKIKKTHLYAGIAIIAAIFAVAVFYLLPIIKQPEIKQISEKGESKEEDNVAWQVDKNGYLSYPPERGSVKFRREDYGIDGNLSLHKITYQSRNGNIYGLLVLPTTASELLPGIVLLPGAGVNKESELSLAKKIALLDAAVLVIDQRGVGETGGALPKFDDDYLSFLKGQEPYQHLMVYDALRAYDLMKNASFVDSDRIIVAGESLGGRIAVIAAAIDRNIKGALVISSSGLDFEETNDTRVNTFLKSVDSDHYLSRITPRKIVMMHNAFDRIIPLSSAISSFEKAEEPKQFIAVNDTNCNHGYCDSMYNGMAEALDYLVDIRSRTLASFPDK
ncbi:alpha/beta fold hydrolase [Candidatus Woesearchaeota archaeon]|nr:alpha/beta fold hydrolase [Candidatus Woesearchaeota archaeon]